MKYISTLLLALLFVFAADAQSTYRYNFSNGLNEVFWKGPLLTTACPGSYKWESLPAGVSKHAYYFNKGCGLYYNDSAKNLLASGSYTIELYFKLDTITGYKKLIDYDSQRVDPGFYNQSGKLALYSKFTSADSFLSAGEYHYLVLTRNGSTKDMYVYHNNTVVGMLNDNNDQYAYSSNKLLVFFSDDNSTNAEQSGGAVAMVNISDYVMDSTTVKGRYTNLPKTLGVDGTVLAGDAISIHPNPANDVVYINTPVAGSYILTDVTGKIQMTDALKQGSNSFFIGSMAVGVYFLKFTDADANGSKVYKIVKQ